MVRKSQVEATAALEAPASTCRHHWLIEAPRGPKSAGRCKLCGQERKFDNGPSHAVWENETLNDVSPVATFRRGGGVFDEDE